MVKYLTISDTYWNIRTKAAYKDYQGNDCFLNSVANMETYEDGGILFGRTETMEQTTTGH